MKKNYYEILDLTTEDKKLDDTKFSSKIKRNFKQKSKKIHPDVNKEDPEATKKFQELNTAYQVLSDPNKRVLYDKYGEDLGKSQGAGQQGGNFADVDLEDIINKMRSGFGFGGGGFQQDPREQGNLRITVPVSLIECFEGAKKKFKYKKQVICDLCGGTKHEKGGSVVKCSRCGGSGMETFRQGNMIYQQTCSAKDCNGTGYIIIKPCHKCNATGVVSKEEVIEIDLPIGVQNGMNIQINETGNEFMFNGKKYIGNLIVQIRELADEKFQRQNNDLHVALDLNILDAIIGSNVSVESIEGKEQKFKLSVGTKQDQTYRLSGLGMKQYGNPFNRGSLFVHINLILPKELNEKELELLNNLKEEEHFKS